jgi:hypothetical protein
MTSMAIHVTPDDPETGPGSELFRVLVGATFTTKDPIELTRIFSETATRAIEDGDPLRVFAHALLDARRLLLELLVWIIAERTVTAEGSGSLDAAVLEHEAQETWRNLIASTPYTPDRGDPLG